MFGLEGSVLQEKKSVLPSIWFGSDQVVKIEVQKLMIIVRIQFFLEKWIVAIFYSNVSLLP